MHINIKSNSAEKMVSKAERIINLQRGIAEVNNFQDTVTNRKNYTSFIKNHAKEGIMGTYKQTIAITGKYFLIFLVLFTSCVRQEFIVREKDRADVTQDIAVYPPLPEATLQGIKTLFVMVAIKDPSGAKSGLAGNKVQSAIEAKIGSAGIEILTYDQWLKDATGAYLYVTIKQMDANNLGNCVYTILFALKQRAALKNNPKLTCFPTTWGKSVTGVVSNKDKAARIIDRTNNLVDVFLSDYLSVNTKSSNNL